MKKRFTFRLDIALLVAVLTVSAVAHGYNMFHFPYYENDEGTYISQAWSFFKTGALAPYTYWYDHAPAGWILMALWAFVTGGFATFGLAVNSGRVFMFVIHVVSTFFLFDIGKKITRQPWAGSIAGLIFSLSPLAIYFQRRVLLDNIMIFWVLLSFWLLVGRVMTLRRVFASATAFGIAMLTKENAIFFFPVLFYAVYRWSDPSHRSFAIVKWVMITGSIVSVYLLYALYKGELLPPVAGEPTHVSLVKTFADQIGRGKRLPFWLPESDFAENLGEWMKKDRILVMIGIGASTLATALSFWHPYFRIPALLGILFWIFLLRGGLIIDFYILPLIPILALNIGMLLDYMVYFLSGANKYRYMILSSIIVLAISGYYIFYTIGQYTRDETGPQQAALSWIYRNLSKETVMAVDAFALVDLWDRGYSNAYWFWKLWADPDVNKKIGNSWERIEYIVASHEMIRTMESRMGSEDILRDAFTNGTKLAMFGPGEGTYLDTSKFKSTNGDWAAIYKVDATSIKELAAAWRYYKQNFIQNYGQVIDSSTGRTTSEGQAYAMLRAVLMGDRGAFDGLWQWTQHHLQSRTQDHLPSWAWKNEKVEDSGTASDADVDMALALLFAARKWSDDQYQIWAKEIILDIWRNEVVTINGRRVLVSSANSSREAGYLVNPSYFSPAHYRIFASVDPSHAWNTLASDTYKTLADIHTSSVYEKITLLVPNWVIVGRDGKITSAVSFVSDDAKYYGYDAFRTSVRVGLDLLWFGREEATSYLGNQQEFWVSEWKKQNTLKAVYRTNGQVRESYTDLSTAAGAFIALDLLGDPIAKEMEKSFYESSYNPGGYWGDKNNYFVQNWAWFASAIATGSFPNLLR